MLGQKSRGNKMDVLRNVHAKFGSTERLDTKLESFAKLDGKKGLSFSCFLEKIRNEMNFSTNKISAQKQLYELLNRHCKCKGPFHCEVFFEHLYISRMYEKFWNRSGIFCLASLIKLKYSGNNNLLLDGELL